MPRGDRTGPMRLGPMTGRGAGYCTGYGAPGFMTPAGHSGFGGRGGDRGWRYWFHATGLPGWARAGMGVPAWGAAPYPYTGPVAPAMPGEAEVDALKVQAGYLEQTLQSLRRRIEKLEGKAKTE
jgi:Family of unknown function (DUF5320)